MIQEYHRPTVLEEALALLARPEMLTLPLGGGTVLSQPTAQVRSPLLAGRAADLPLAVVDVQALGLETVERRGSGLVLGAAVRLQDLLDLPGLPPALALALRYEVSYNLRRMRTLAGALVCADGRSPLATALLALDVMLECVWQGGKHSYSLGELLPVRRTLLPGKLITRITIPLAPRLNYEYAARTPADLPLVCAAAARWPSGRTRLTLGGYGAQPVLVLDGADLPPNPLPKREGAFEYKGAAEYSGEEGAAEYSGESGPARAARAAYRLAGDEWAGAEYRSQTAAVLAERCLRW